MLGLVPWRIVAAVLLVVAIAAAWWKVTHLYETRGYQRAQAESAAIAAAQADRNRELQRAAEKRYVVQAEAREKVITETIVEVRNATAPIADCRVPADAVRLFNRAAECARTDTAASCGAGDEVRSPS